MQAIIALMVRISLFFTFLAAAAAAQDTATYCFGMLRTVADRATISTEEVNRIQAAHLAHLTALAENGWLRAAGPMATPGELRGLEISRCKSVKEAMELGSQDPAITHNRLRLEAYSWNGPAGLGDRYRQEKNEPGYKQKMVKHPMAMLLTTEQWKGTPSMALLKAHGERTQAMLKDGRMKGAGPFENGGEKIGVFIFAPMGLDEAKQIAEADPLVKAGLAKIQMYEWYTVDGTFR